MTDYDARSIPILDDIIEIDVSGESSDENTVDSNSETIVAEDHLDLFLEETVQSANEKDEPQIGIINELDEDVSIHIETGRSSSADTAAAEAELSDIIPLVYQTETDDTDESEDQPALIQYPLEPESSDTGFAIDDEDDVRDEPAAQLIEGEPLAIEPLVLESMVEDIVKQLIPDLEQQLRYRVRQALEDKLGDAVISRLNNSDDKN